MNVKCVVCDSGNLSTDIVPDYLYCLSCGVYFQADMPAEADTLNYYSSGDYRNERQQKDEREHQRRRASNVIQYIDNVSAFVDVGCSMGVLVDAVQAKFPDAHCYGVDIDPVLADQTKVYKSINDIPELADCVTAIHTLEHIATPKEFLADVYAKMADGGRLIVEVPNGDTQVLDYYRSAFCKAHVVMYSIRSLKSTLERAGFTVQDIFLHGSGGVIGAPEYYYLMAIAQKNKMNNGT